jgi:hypothetical protein
MKRANLAAQLAAAETELTCLKIALAQARGCSANPSSPALILGTRALQPVAARPAPIAAAGALRHNTLQAQLAGVGEHHCAITSDRLAKLDAGDAADQARESLSALLQRPLAEIVALEAEKIEGDIRGSRAGGLGAQCAEIGMAARKERHRLAVDQGALGRQAADRRRDGQELGGEIRPVSAPDIDALALLFRERSESVVLDLVQPARPDGRVGDEGWLAGSDEAGRRWSAKKRGGTPQHASVRGARVKSSTGPAPPPAKADKRARR